LWQVDEAGVRVVPRPGKSAQIDFPVTPLGEITGTVFREEGGTPRPTPGVTVELVRDDGTVASRARSAYDGFYDLSRVPPGHYLVRAAAPQLERLGLLLLLPGEVTIGAEGSVVDGVDLVLEKGLVAADRDRDKDHAAGMSASLPAGQTPTNNDLEPAPGPPAETVAGRQSPAVALGERERFAVQLASRRDPQGAQSDAVAFSTDLGYPTHVVTVHLGDKGLFHRVLLGEFATREQARKVAAGLAERGYDVGPVVTLPPGA
jgi:cell division septation protein DedD